ncbi:MAG TPA: hypothetical protein VJW75_02425, partial [Candidatus Eisenbacteria bacterium]|nr:hypothetical protein [Candidatus Eisenbacteria bacterium]
MSDSKTPGPMDASRVVAETQFVPRLQRMAVSLGLASIAAAALIGWSAYRVSRSTLIQGYFENARQHVRACAEALARSPSPSLDADALAELRVAFEEERPFPDAYLCVLGSRGRLLLHTRNPSFEGRVMGADLLFDPADASEPPFPVVDLLDALRNASGRDRSRTGTMTSTEGERQMIAFAYSPRFDALVAIHAPWKSVEHQVNRATLPWAIGLGLIVLLAVPLSLFGLSKAYVEAQRKLRRARDAESRAAEQIQNLHEIDRAIAAGESVTEIVQAALVRMRDLATYHRASVSLF